MITVPQRVQDEECDRGPAPQSERRATQPHACGNDGLQELEAGEVAECVGQGASELVVPQVAGKDPRREMHAREGRGDFDDTWHVS